MRVDELAEQMGDEIEIEWKSFLLRVEPKTDDRDRFVEYTKSWLNPAEQEPNAKFQVWHSDADQPPSSVPAQVAFKVLARTWPDKAEAYHRRLLEAYFSENRNIADAGELLALAEEVGVDAAEFRAAAEEHQQSATEEVINEHNFAIQNEITAVPTVIFNDTFPVPGAQPTDTYIRIVEAIKEHETN